MIKITIAEILRKTTTPKEKWSVILINAFKKLNYIERKTLMESCSYRLEDLLVG